MLRAKRPEPEAVDWLESPQNPTHWERGRRPESVCAGRMVSIKDDRNDDCGAWREDFCLCIGAMPDQIHSLDYTADDEAKYMRLGIEPRFSDGKWAKARRLHREEWQGRALQLRVWRAEREQLATERYIERRKHVVRSGNGARTGDTSGG